jgi:hypothetical protein
VTQPAPSITPISEQWHAGGFVVWDPSDGLLTAQAITLLQAVGDYVVGAETLVLAGTVLGQCNAGAASAAALGTNTGNGTFGAITVAQPATPGVYAVEFDSATTFIVSSPNGQEIGHGVTGTVFNTGGLHFTITAGGTAFVAADSFDITVAAGTGFWVPYDPTGNDGREVAAGILYNGYIDVTNANQPATAYVRGPMRVLSTELVWGLNVTTTPQQTTALAQLLALGILAT